MSTDDSPERKFDVYDSEAATLKHEESTSNLMENPKSSRKPRREVWWHDLGATNHSLKSIGRCFEDHLNRSLLSSSYSLLRRIRSPKDDNLGRSLHQCPGYLREEITLTCDVSKSVIVSHAFPGPSERCSICHQLVPYSYSDSRAQYSEGPKKVRRLLPVYFGWRWMQNRSKMPTGAKKKERWVHLSFIEFQEDADGWKQKEKITDAYVEEGTSGQGFRPNKAGPMKDRQILSQTPEEESTSNKGPSKKKKPAASPKQNVRRQTAPAEQTIPGPSISINNGSRTMYNKDVGNIHYTYLSKVE